MNLPSSLALSPSKLLQSRLGILVLALVVVAAGGGVYLLTQRPAKPPVTATPATSPAAQALAGPSTLPGRVPQAPAQRVFGPPAPESMLRPAPVAPAAGAGTAYGPPAPESMLKPAPAAPMASAPMKPAVVYPPAPLAANPAAPATPAATAASATAATATSPAMVTSPATVATAAPVTATKAAADGAKALDASVLFARDQYVYTNGGRRDPFQSLIDGRFQGQITDAGLVDVGDIHLVGIMWGSSDKFALVEDSRGHGYVLRVGDPVVNGYISGITKSELQIVQNAFGDSQTLSIHLQPKEGDKNANRN
jgi:hypothetical protein